MNTFRAKATSFTMTFECTIPDDDSEQRTLDVFSDISDALEHEARHKFSVIDANKDDAYLRIAFSTAIFDPEHIRMHMTVYFQYLICEYKDDGEFGSFEPVVKLV